MGRPRQSSLESGPGPDAREVVAVLFVAAAALVGAKLGNADFADFSNSQHPDLAPPAITTDRGPDHSVPRLIPFGSGDLAQ